MKSIFSRYLIVLFSLAFSIAIAIKVIATPVDLKADNVSIVDRATELYQKEQYFDASKAWQQAISYFEQKQDTLNQAMALSNLALTQQKLGDLGTAESTINSSLQLLHIQSYTTTQQRILANSLDVKGSIARSQGRSQIALEIWQQAEKIYQELNEKEIIKNKINQTQALQDLGYYRRANKLINSVVNELDKQPNSLNKVPALLTLSNTLRVTGNLDKSLEVLKQALKIAKNSKDTETEKLILLNLGNTIYQLGDRQKLNTSLSANSNTPQCLADNNSADRNSWYLQAANCYQQAILSNNLATKTKAQLNLLDLIISERDKNINPLNLGDINSQSLSNLIVEIRTNLNQLPPTRSTIYDRLNLVQSLICLQPNKTKYSSPLVQQCSAIQEDNLISWRDIETEANFARQQARQLQDKQAQAYADGYLGAIYQQTGKSSQALALTQQAILDSNITSDSVYLWQWQLGRIYRGQNQLKPAIEAYNSAFDSLQTLRANLLATNPTTQFAFRDRIEPLYRERAALLLDNNPTQANLIAARDTIEALQLAQLNNFFREACINAKPQNIENIDPHAAVVYSIILGDRLAIILSQSGQPLKYYQTKITPQQIERVFTSFYTNLSPFLAITDPLQPNQTLYNWLIRPLETQLQQNQTKTLVFILDGALSSIPIAALHDGKQYLVEKYNLALTPGLQLLTPAFNRQNIQTIAGGLTSSRQGFNSLPNVATEVNQIAELVPSQILLDREFTSEKLRSQINSQPYPVVHLATHGQFSSRAEDTFLLTWSDRINVKDLDTILQDRDFTQDTPIELLILSACQTATGDKQAALGLAGVAVRSGARSTVATLWSIQDDSTAQLMTEFYRALKTSETKAQALRQAQLKLLHNPKYEHPFYWSAFVLVGNWL